MCWDKELWALLIEEENNECEIKKVIVCLVVSLTCLPSEFSSKCNVELLIFVLASKAKTVFLNYLQYYIWKAF